VDRLRLRRSYRLRRVSGRARNAPRNRLTKRVAQLPTRPDRELGLLTSEGKTTYHRQRVSKKQYAGHGAEQIQQKWNW
jgi:hypothetical protein